MKRELIKEIPFDCADISKSGVINKTSNKKYLMSVYKYPGSGPHVKEKFTVEATCNGTLIKAPVDRATEKEALALAKNLTKEIQGEEDRRVTGRKSNMEARKKRAQDAKLSAKKNKD